MPSPFPGMNPYLEQDDVWQDFHQSFIPLVREVLGAQVRPAYFVKVEEYRFIHEMPANGRRPLGRADVSVTDPGVTTAGSQPAGVLEAPADGRLPMAVDIERHSYLPLPPIPVPLRAPHPDARLDLQAVLHRLYDAAGYEEYVYTGTPQPPLSPEDEGWARQFVPAAAGGGEGDAVRWTDQGDRSRCIPVRDLFPAGWPRQPGSRRWQQSLVDQQLVVFRQRNEAKSLIRIQGEQMLVIGHHVVSTGRECCPQDGAVCRILGNFVTRSSRLNERRPLNDPAAGEHGKTSREAQLVRHDTFDFVQKRGAGIDAPRRSLGGFEEQLGCLAEQGFGDVDVGVEKDLHEG